MNVMYAADEKFAEILGVSMLSLLESHQDTENIRFFIVSDEISEENIRRLRDMVARYHRELIFLKKPNMEGRIGVNPDVERWSDSAYSRLFLEELFQSYPEVDKLLYLDCDVMIASSLQKLWETDVNGYLGAACLECMGNLHKRAVGLKKTDPYFNSGVLLLNIKKWRADKIGDVLNAFIRDNRGWTEYPDQGIINGAIGRQLKILNPRYNLTTLAYDFTWEEMQIYRKPALGYSKKEWQQAMADPAIIHFTTSFLSLRPWQEGSTHPYAKKWKEYLDRSPWGELPLCECKASKKREIISKLYHSVPGNISVLAAGFMHAYVKPLRYLIERWIYE